jgi:uncharacterized protein
MHKNETLLKDAYDAYAKGDIAGLTAGWTDDVVWHLQGDGPVGGDHKGAEDILKTLGEIVGLASSFDLKVEKIFADDTTGVALCRTKMSYGDQKFDVVTTHVHRITDGKVAETWFLFDDSVRISEAQQAAFDAAAAKA